MAINQEELKSKTQEELIEVVTRLDNEKEELALDLEKEKQKANKKVEIKPHNFGDNWEVR